MPNCPVCGDPNAQVGDEDAGNRAKVNCPACSTFVIVKRVAGKYRNNPKYPPRLRYRIRKMQRQDANNYPFISEEMAARFAEEPLPSVREQADTLLLQAGDELRESNPAGWANLRIPQCVASIGAYDKDALQEVIKTIGTEERLINFRVNGDVLGVAFTFKGWERYEEIRRAPSEARLAFMAMPFGDDRLDRLFREIFRPAIKATGFDLRRIDEAPRAGVIDDNLRVEIRKARFLIAELTGKNAGAYWEAGFAEGLGRPVFYTCEKDYFDQNKTHFDTNHCLTILWTDTDDGRQKTASDLKASIRATLPAEALQTDPG